MTRSLAGQMAAMAQHIARAGHAADTGVCRVPGCGGVLRFEIAEFGRLVDVCTRCEDRVRRAAPIEGMLRRCQAELAAVREREAKALQREQFLKARVEQLEATSRFTWEPGLCVRCGAAVPYSGRGRVPLYCERSECQPKTVQSRRRRVA